MLEKDVSRLEELLSMSRSERDELAIKYEAMADRVRSIKIKEKRLAYGL